MDQLIEDIKLHVDMYEADEDKESAAFYVNILGRIRGHESETAKLRQQLKEMTAIAADHRDGRLAALEQLADCQKDLAEIRTAIDDEVKSYERYGAACLFDGCDMIYAYTLRDIAAIAKDQKND